MTLLVLAAPAYSADLAQRYYEAARRAERAGDIVGAYNLYSRAAALKPTDPTYAAGRRALQVRAALAAEAKTAAPPRSAADLVALGQLTPSEVAEARAANEPPRLEPSPGRKSFDLRGDARDIIGQVAGAFGIQAVYGADYLSPPQFTFRVDNLEGREALRALETVTNSLFVPVGPRLMLVERDTTQRRADTMPAMALAIPIPERMSVQEAQEIVTAVQQTLEIRRSVVDPGRRLVFLRDQAAKVIPARALFHQLSQQRAQVEVEIEFLAVTKNSALHYGLTTPTSTPIVNFGDFFNHSVRTAAGFTRFLTFGGGATFLGFGVADASLLANLSRNSAASILASQVVAVDGQAAQLHVGDRYPIIVNGYVGDTSGGGQVFTPPPTVNFQELGLLLKITPSVHGEDEVTLEVEAEYNVLGADSFNNIPVISRRKYNGKVRLTIGESAVIAGLVKSSVGETSDGLWGLHRVPWIGRLFRNNTTTREDSEVLVVLRPRLTHLPPSAAPSPVLWVGAESKPLTVY